MEDIELLVESASNNFNSSICITNTKEIIFAIGVLKEYISKEITDELLDKMDERILWQNKGENKINIINDCEITRSLNQVIAPIIYEGSVLGSVILLTNDSKKQITDSEIKVVKVMADYLASRM